MLQTLSKIQIIDNSGVKLGQCIKVFGKKDARIGDLILISVKKLKKYAKLKIKKKTIFKALVVNTKKEKQYKDHTYFKYDTNQIILLNNTNTLIGTRILGVLSKNLRTKNFIKFLTQATYLI